MEAPHGNEAHSLTEIARRVGAYDRCVRVRRLALPLTAMLVAACTSGGSSSPATETASPGGATSTLVPPETAAWPLFGYDPARTNAFEADTGIAAGVLDRLRRQRVELPGTADSSPIYVRGLLLVATSYGKVVAIDADTGEIVWTFVPDGIEGWEGTSQITQSSPAADPEENYVYSFSPDGRLHKLSLADGREVRSEGWPAVVTKDPRHEKSAPALNLVGDLVLLATGGYVGDAPPYQGHVVAVDRRSGRLVNVFNTLCSDRKGLLDPPSCPESGSAIWGRGGVVVDPDSGNLLVSTGDGAWNGSTYWGDSVLVLSPNAGELRASYTPENEAELDAGDVDLASASPAVIPPHFVVQGGKDGLLRVLDLRKLGQGEKGGESDIATRPGRPAYSPLPPSGKWGAPHGSSSRTPRGRRPTSSTTAGWRSVGRTRRRARAPSSRAGSSTFMTPLAAAFTFTSPNPETSRPSSPPEPATGTARS